MKTLALSLNVVSCILLWFLDSASWYRTCSENFGLRGTQKNPYAVQYDIAALMPVNGATGGHFAAIMTRLDLQRPTLPIAGDMTGHGGTT